jgi:hypothetical protein
LTITQKVIKIAKSKAFNTQFHLDKVKVVLNRDVRKYEKLALGNACKEVKIYADNVPDLTTDSNYVISNISIFQINSESK